MCRADTAAMQMRAPPCPVQPPVPGLQAGAGYAAALRLLGIPVLTLDLAAEGRVVGQAQVVLRRFPVLGCVAWLPLGPVWQTGTNRAAQVAALARLVRRLPATGARLWISTAADVASDAAFSRAGHVALRRGFDHAMLDLSPGPDALRRNLGGKWRNALVRAETAALRLHDGRLPIDPDHWLLRAELAQRRARGYRAWPTALTLAYARANPGDAHVFWATQDDTPVAGLVILRHGTGASYHLGWSGPAGRASAAHQALIWRAIRWLGARGVTRLDLGLVDPARAPGLARFKLGTGATVRPMGRTWLHQPGMAALWRQRA